MFTLLGPNYDQGVQKCCEADLGSRIKISGHPLGQSASLFEIYPFRLVLVGGDGTRDKAIGQRREGGLEATKVSLKLFLHGSSAWR